MRNGKLQHFNLLSASRFVEIPFQLILILGSAVVMCSISCNISSASHAWLCAPEPYVTHPLYHYCTLATHTGFILRPYHTPTSDKLLVCVPLCEWGTDGTQSGNQTMRMAKSSAVPENTLR